MDGVEVCVLVFLAVTVAAGLRNVIEYEIERLLENGEFNAESWEISKSKIYARRQPVRLTKWGYKDCSDGKGTMKINALNISPDPVVTPGPLYVDAKLDVTQDIVSVLKGNVTIFRYSRIFKKYQKLPCIANFGSCIYDDVCTLLGQITQCPDQLKAIGLTCHCPIKQNSYFLDHGNFTIDSSAFPHGDFIMIGNLTNNGMEVGCLNISISFE